MKILHLSDLHFHRNKSDNKKILKTLDTIKDKYGDHYIVITGDIVDDGHKDQYKNAYEALKDFKNKLFIVPGNHDFGAVGILYSRGKARRFDDMLSIPLNQDGEFIAENKPVVNIVKDESDEVMFIGLDSNLETEDFFDFACGEIGKTQRSALSVLLNDRASYHMKKVLFFHHHPFMHSDPFMELRDAEKLARVIYGKVDVVMFGHKHKRDSFPNIWGIPYVIASNNSPGKKKAGEVAIENGKISFKYVDI
jgi:3',5'-cyclic AMP phosphodiesterase CpdA